MGKIIYIYISHAVLSWLPKEMRKRPRLDLAHAQDDMTPHKLRLLEDTFAFRDSDIKVINQ